MGSLFSSSDSSASASASASTSVSASSSTDTTSLYAMFGFVIVGIIFYIVSFVTTSKFLGSSNNWNEIQPIIGSIIGPALAGCIVLCIALGIYINQMINSVNVIYIIMVISILALSMSYTALALSVVTKSS